GLRTGAAGRLAVHPVRGTGGRARLRPRPEVHSGAATGTARRPGPLRTCVTRHPGVGTRRHRRVPTRRRHHPATGGIGGSIEGNGRVTVGAQITHASSRQRPWYWYMSSLIPFWSSAAFTIT